jgi:hypothetical protein
MTETKTTPSFSPAVRAGLAVSSLPEVCLAPKAQRHCQPGATSQDLWNEKPPALKARLISALNRAFSASLRGGSNPWGAAPGSCEESAVGATQIFFLRERLEAKGARKRGTVTPWQR